MNNNLIIACNIGTTDKTVPLGIEVWLDNQLVLNMDHVINANECAWEISDADSEHELKFVMKNKSPEHTKINEQGQIVQDATLTIGNLTFQEIEMEKIFLDKAVYTHDFNGTQNTIDTKFYGEMGCNGTLIFKFATPVYSWLLENMNP